MATTAIVLAAGKGTRMKSDLPKVLIPVCGRPMVEHVLDTLSSAGVERTLVVVGYRSDLVRQQLAGRTGVAFVEQTEQRGTGHAVMMCREQLVGYEGPVVIVTGDSPLAQRESIEALLAHYAAHHPACLLGTAHKSEPRGLGRIVRDATGAFQAIVEERDATPDERLLTEVNMSCYVFHGPDLLAALDKLGCDNAQGEYYLTDCPGLLRRAGRLVEALAVLQPIEALSINTPEELAVAERAMQDENRARGLS